LITICCITYVIVFNSIKMMLLINSLMTQQLGWIIQIGQCHYVWAMADWQWCELELGMIYAWRQSINNSWGIDCWTCWSHLLINTLHCFGWWVFWSRFWHCSTENTSTLGTLYVLFKIQEKNISIPFLFIIWGRLIILIYYFHYNNKFWVMLACNSFLSTLILNTHLLLVEIYTSSSKLITPNLYD
jgi:hypothetical protein